LFAILAAAGDVGAALGPFAAGVVTDLTRSLPASAATAAALGLSVEQYAIRAAILLAAVFPVLTLYCHWVLRKWQKASEPTSLAALFRRRPA
jgi:hypothetical protein